MNRSGHLIWSEFILIISMGTFLIVLLTEYGLRSIIVAFICSVGAFLLGAIAPDFDHHAVQKKSFMLRWMKNITKHRGHWHSLFAMFVYGVLLFLVFFWLIKYWYIPLGVGMFGLFSHLLLDELKNLKTNGSKALKIF